MAEERESAGRPGVREILTAEELHGMAAEAGMSEEQLAKALAPISGLPSGVLQIGFEAGGALGRSFGFKSRKTAELSLACSYTAAVRGLVFGLSSLRYGLTAMFDTPRGAYFEARLPGDLFSPGGSLQFDVEEVGPDRIRVVAASEIKGQMYDWGKGKRALADALEKTQMFAARLG
jgi:hypothetical protein